MPRTPSTPRRHIVISGASSGIGAQLAREYAARGRHLGLCARRLDRLEGLRDELTAAHPGITVAVRALDVTDPAAVFTAFDALHEELGAVDRVIVNAGVSGGAPVGTGGFAANLTTMQTNLIGALAQCEAAMRIFRAQRSGHLVVISSLAALRGLPGGLSSYAASKAGLATLAEGIRADALGTPIRVSTILPGYIRSEMNPPGVRNPLLTETVPAVRAMVRAVEREPATANVPPWPWDALAVVLRHAPLRLLKRFTTN
jgi:short-subunit dehydrogenase